MCGNNAGSTVQLRIGKLPRSVFAIFEISVSEFVRGFGGPESQPLSNSLINGRSVRVEQLANSLPNCHIDTNRKIVFFSRKAWLMDGGHPFVEICSEQIRTARLL